MTHQEQEENIYKMGDINMSKRAKKHIKSIIISINKHIHAIFYMFMLYMGVLALGKLIYESGILLIIDVILGTVFG